MKTGFWLKGGKGKLAGSIFGLDYYVKKLNYVFKKEKDSERNTQQ